MTRRNHVLFVDGWWRWAPTWRVLTTSCILARPRSRKLSIRSPSMNPVACSVLRSVWKDLQVVQGQGKSIQGCHVNPRMVLLARRGRFQQQGTKQNSLQIQSQSSALFSSFFLPNDMKNIFSGGAWSFVLMVAQPYFILQILYNGSLTRSTQGFCHAPRKTPC